jgi:bifunctional non-homologous end joining protein LigD
LGDNEIVLDGEIIGLNDADQIDFGEVSRRNTVSSPARIKSLSVQRPCFYMAFDLLYLNGTDCRGAALKHRREALEELAGRLFDGPIRLVPQSDDGAAIMKAAHQLGLEGVMAKMRDSLYRDGRSPAWLKLKPTHRSTFIVTGMTDGSGARAATFGSLILSLWDGAQLVEMGEVGSGFTQADLQDVLGRVAAGQVLMVEVEYQEVTKDGRLRFPVFRGLRDDIEFTDCSTAQLDAEIDVSHIA